jgi:ubiquitin carboxyl-terminal hydrolase 8
MHHSKIDGSYRKHVNRDNPLGTKGMIADSFTDLLKNIWSDQEIVVNPSKFKVSIFSFMV